MLKLRPVHGAALGSALALPTFAAAPARAENMAFAGVDDASHCEVLFKP